MKSTIQHKSADGKWRRCEAKPGNCRLEHRTSNSISYSPNDGAATQATGIIMLNQQLNNTLHTLKTEIEEFREGAAYFVSGVYSGLTSFDELRDELNRLKILRSKILSVKLKAKQYAGYSDDEQSKVALAETEKFADQLTNSTRGLRDLLVEAEYYETVTQNWVVKPNAVAEKNIGVYHEPGEYGSKILGFVGNQSGYRIDTVLDEFETKTFTKYVTTGLSERRKPEQDSEYYEQLNEAVAKRHAKADELATQAENTTNIYEKEKLLRERNSLLISSNLLFGEHSYQKAIEANKNIEWDYVPDYSTASAIGVKKEANGDRTLSFLEYGLVKRTATFSEENWNKLATHLAQKS